MKFFQKKPKNNLQSTEKPIPEKPAPKKEDKKVILPKILVYGIETMGLTCEQSNIVTSNFELEFAPLDTNNKFYDYDGVILFQSTFENIEKIDGYHTGLKVTYDRDELVKRRNQATQLLDKRGFICFLIHRNFVMHAEYQQDLSDTDLCKIYLSFSSFYKESLGADCLVSKIYRSEFNGFLKDYGIARVKFSYYSDWLEAHIKKVCDSGSNTLTGLIMLDSCYFIPCRLPSADEVEDFFKKIASSLVATSKKLIQEIPAWVDGYRFKEEEKILDEEVKLQKQIEELSNKKDIYKRYKRCLCYDGELLAESVTEVLRESFGLGLADKKDEHLEDRALLDDDKKEIALIEIKGSNENVKNPNIYQADSHRGRRGKSADFPSILIVNTFIKPSNSIQEKLRDIGAEQIKLAVDKKVLVMRSIDLLNLLYLKEENKVTRDEIVGIFAKQYGWLSVSQDNYEIKS